MRKFIALVTFFFVTAFVVTAQSSERVSEIISADYVSNAQVAYLAASYKNLTGDNPANEDLYKVLNENGFSLDIEKADEKADLQSVCYVFAKATDLKGGICYSLFKSPRYALRELKANGIIPSKSDPSMKISGRQTISILKSCIELSGGNK